MKRWSGRKGQYVTNRAVDAFIEDLLIVCQRHGFSIGHEDSHGAFTVENLKPSLESWLRAAHDETTAPTRPAPPTQPELKPKGDPA